MRRFVVVVSLGSLCYIVADRMRLEFSKDTSSVLFLAMRTLFGSLLVCSVRIDEDGRSLSELAWNVMIYKVCSMRL